MGAIGVRRLGAGVVMVGGAAVAAAMLGLGVARADDNTVDINGWTVQLDPETQVSPQPTLNSASGTLMDPTDALGMGKEVSGNWFSATSPLVDLVSPEASTDGFGSSADTSSLGIENVWLAPWLEFALVETDNGAAFDLLAPAVGGKEVVDLLDVSAGDAPPLINPDATGPVTVGGLDLASPQDGALLNDLYDAMFNGDTAGWGKAATLFGDLLGVDPSSAADAVDAGSWLADLGF